jgi:hypothetical protein
MPGSQGADPNGSITVRVTDLENIFHSLLLLLKNLTAPDGKSLLGTTYNMADYLSTAIKLQRKTEAKVAGLHQRTHGLEEEMKQSEKRVNGMAWEIRGLKDMLAEQVIRFEMEKERNEKVFKDFKGLFEKTVQIVEAGRLEHAGSGDVGQSGASGDGDETDSLDGFVD